MGVGRELEADVTDRFGQLIKTVHGISIQSGPGNDEHPVRVPDRATNQAGAELQFIVICGIVSLVMIDAEVTVTAELAKAAIDTIESWDLSRRADASLINHKRSRNSLLKNAPRADGGTGR
jgi:hypothetical protein